MDKKETKGALEFIVEIERLPYTDKESWFNAMKGFQTMHRLANGMSAFEVFDDADIRRSEISKSSERIARVSLDNTIPGARITDFDLDPEGDLYYAKIRVPDNPEARIRINMGNGKFIPRLFAHNIEVTEDGKKKNMAMVDVMLCMDFVWKKGENIDEVQSGSEDSCEGNIGNETPDSVGTGNGD